MSHMKDKAIDQMNNDLNVSNSYLFKLRDGLGIINAIIGHEEAKHTTIHELSMFVQSELDRRFPSEIS